MAASSPTVAAVDQQLCDREDVLGTFHDFAGRDGHKVGLPVRFRLG
jgi:hypothetical protein